MRRLLLVCTLLVSGCTHYIFFPMEEHVLTPEAIGIRYEDVFLDTVDDIRLHGWKLLGEGEKQGTLLFFHGNAENISTHFANVYWLVPLGYDVYLFDYRGYGRSQGEAELDPIIDDMQLQIGYVVDQLSESEKLIIMGQSLGASLAIYAVAHSPYRDKLDALISVSAFSDYHDIAQDALAKSWLFWLFQWPLSKTISNTYSPLKVVDQVSPIPVYFLHSREDEIIDYYHAERLYQAAREPKSLVTLGGGHNVTFNMNSNREKLVNTLDEIQTR